MARKILLAYCFLQIVVFALGAGIYSVVGPGTIHSNFKYSVAISLHKAEGPAKIQVGITGPSYNESKIVQVDPMSTKTVDFDVPNLSSGEYNLTSVGLSGITFENSTSLNVADSKPSIFIQTDKATYKPGDLVQFRVIFLDENTRPAKINTPVNIEISDALKNILKQIKNVKFTKGVYTDSFPLSAETVLGDWTISVYNNGEKAEQKVFEVAKYVLPKFDVTIDTAKDVAIPSNVIKATVRSKYTYGKPVKGKAVISVSPSYHYYGSFNDNLVAEKTIDVDGKGHVEFDLTKDLRLSADRSYVPPLNILVVMEEALTGNKQNTSTTVNLHIETYRIEGVNTPYSFHPGKPVVFTIVVKNLDGTPVQDTKNSAKLLVDSPRGYFHRTWIPTDMSLVSPVPEPPTMEFESKLDKNGMATFEFTLPTNAVSYYSVRAKYLDSNAYLSSLSQYSAPVEQVEKLKITVTPEKPHLKDNVTVEVLSKERIPYFVYTIVGRGNILKSEHVEVPEASKSHKFTIVPTFEMMPKFKILIHYVFENDLQFEEHTVNMEKGFENSIAISAPVEVKPGDDVKLDVQTDPDSYVGLLGVDQSVLLLKSGNDIKKDDVFNKIEGIDTSTPWMRGYGRYPGQQTGLVTMTNANYPYNHAQLAHYQEDLPLVLATDASSYGIGVVLSHTYVDGTERPIAFASKTLDIHQRRYSQIEKEGLAIVFGVKRFHQYLYGRRFTLVTDHKPLVSIFNPIHQLPSMTSHRLQRWAIILMAYQYDVRYRKTTEHGNADALSRLPVGEDKTFDHEESCFNINELNTPIDAEIIRQHAKNDPILRRVYFLVTNGWPEKLMPQDADLRSFFNHRFALILNNNLLCLQTEYNRVVIPASLKQKVLKLLHDGHWGVSRMKQLARQHVWWTNIDKDIAQLTENCDVCKIANPVHAREYVSWPEADRPWERVHIDFAGPFCNSMWLICVDAFSQFPFVVQLSTTTTVDTVSALSSIFSLEGIPETIVSDNGPQFTAEAFKQFCSKLGIKHITTAPFHPASNGLAERFVRSFKTAVQKNIDDGLSLKFAVSKYLATYRAMPNAEGKSPAELLHGRPVRTLLSQLFESPRKHLEASKRKMKFSLKQPVFARNYARGEKWIKGVIVKQLGKMVYRVNTSFGYIKRHVNQLKTRSSSDLSSQPIFEFTPNFINATPPSSSQSTLMPSEERSTEVVQLRKSCRIRKDVNRFESDDFRKT